MSKKKGIQKVLTPKDVKKIITCSSNANTDTEQIFKKLKDEIIPKFQNGNKKERDGALKEFNETAHTFLRINENDSRIALMSSFEKNFWGVSKELSKQIEKDYDCITSLEKSMVGVISNAYLRILDNSQRLNKELNCTSITPERNKYISNLSIQVDRANRQFIQSILALKQLKAPALCVNIKTKNAYISQNQQINTNKENNEAK